VGRKGERLTGEAHPSAIRATVGNARRGEAGEKPTSKRGSCALERGVIPVGIISSVRNRVLLGELRPASPPRRGLHYLENGRNASHVLPGEEELEWGAKMRG